MLPLAPLLLAGAVTVAPGNTCPTDDAISTELTRLGALSAVDGLGTAEVTVQGAALHIVVRDRRGVALGRRTVDAPAECDARAALAAVLIAAWAGDWARTRIAEGEDSPGPRSAASAGPERGNARPSGPSSVTTGLADTHKETPAVAAVPAAPSVPVAVRPAPPVESSPASAPASPPALAHKPVSRTPAVSRSTGAREPFGLAFEAALLGSGLHDGNQGTIAVGGQLAVRGRRYALVGLAETIRPRDRGLGVGSVRYGALRTGVGVSARKEGPRAFVEVVLLPELACYTLEGKNLATNRSVVAWGPLVDARVHAGLRFQGWAPFAYLGASYSLMRERLTLDDASDATTLGRWNLAAGLGVSLRLWGR